MYVEIKTLHNSWIKERNVIKIYSAMNDKVLCVKVCEMHLTLSKLGIGGISLNWLFIKSYNEHIHLWLLNNLL